MPPGFSSDFKESVRAQTDLAGLIGESISLAPRRGGAEYVGLCPFHEDHTPSLHVYPDRQSYRCWVCDKGGDCFSWVQHVEQVEFREALEMLARRAGIELPAGYQRGASESGPGKSDLYDVVAWAEGLFHQCLLESPLAEPARRYLAERRFEAATIERFRLGYHPDDWDWLQRQARGRFTPQQLLAARVAGERSNGPGCFDYFVDRVMFPICDARGRCVAFGGRVIPGRAKSDAKYFNSPESSIFPKSRLLYGLDIARDGIRKSATAVVVEGYTDCITAHQYGLSNFLATLGTSLTETHVTMLKRFARKVVLVYDGDGAGQAAAERSLAKFLAHDVDLRVLTLPVGLDPADFLAKRGREALQSEIEQAPEALEHKLHRTIARFGTESIDARQQVLLEMLELVAEAPRLAGTSREGMVLNRLAQRLGVTEELIRQQLQETKRKKTQGQAARRPADVRVDPGQRAVSDETNSLKSKQSVLECEVLGIIFSAPEMLATIRERLVPQDFANARLRQLFEFCCNLAEKGTAPAFERVTSVLEDAELKRLAVWIDDQARDKRVLEKLRTDRGSPPEPSGPAVSFLDATIENLKWCQEERLHERSKGQMAHLGQTPRQLDEDARMLLHQAAEYHQKRATKKTLNRG